MGQTARHIANFLAFRLKYHPTGSPDGRLPTVRELSKTFEASAKTIVQVLSYLEEWGFIRRKRGRGGCEIAGRGLMPDLQPLERKMRSRRYHIAAEIRKDIAAGISGANGDSMPSQLELSKSLQCSQATVRGALEILAKEHVITREGAGYRISLWREAAGSTARVYVFGSEPVLRHLEGQYQPFYRSLETELADAGWNPPQPTALDEKVASAPPQSSDLCGLILIDTNIPAAWHQWLAMPGTPPLVLFLSSFRKLTAPKRLTRLCILQPDDEQAGKAVAHHLYDAGHRVIAVFSHSSDVWAETRIQGILDYCNKEQSSARIVRYDIARDEERIAGTWSPAQRIRALTTNDHGLSPFLSPSIMEQLYKAFSHSALIHGAHNVFGQALTDASITAWICINDDIALMAQSFLRRSVLKNRKSPVIAGFDNSVAAALSGITSYGFNFSHMGRLAARYMISPDAIHSTHGRYIAVPGKLVVRASTGMSLL